MTNIEKLDALGILDVVRKRQGANDGSDESHDYIINEMNNSTLVKQWCGWYLGDSSWWAEMKYLFDQLNEMDNQTDK